MKHARTRGTLAAALSLTAALVVTACSAESEDPRSAATAATVSQPTTIEYWHINTKAFGADAIDELISEFNDTHDDITVEGRFYDGYSNLLTALQTSLVSDGAPAVAQIGYSRIGYVTSTFPFVPMTDLGVDLSGYDDTILELGQVGGEQAGVPYGLSALQVFYNADLLEQAGIDPTALPTTWEDWRSAAERMKAELNLPLINFQQFAGDNYIPQAMVSGNGGAVLSCVDGSPMATFNSDEGVAAIGLMGQLAQDGLATNLSSEQAMQAFLGGQTATLITGSSVRASVESQARFSLGVTQFPSFGAQPLAIPAGGNALFSFARTNDEKVAAREFIDFVATEDSSVTTYVESTGYVPALEGAAAAYTAANPLQQAASEATEFFVPWVSFPGEGGLEASQIMFDATQAIMGGTGSVQQVLDEAADQINADIAGSGCE